MPHTITVTQAVAILPISEQVHTIQRTMVGSCGCDVDRSKLIDAMATHGVELSDLLGELEHRLLIRLDGRTTFVETVDVRYRELVRLLAA
jgi:hypothetical protein